MLKALIARPTSVVVASLAVVVLGGFSLLRLPVSLLPTLERPRLVLTVEDSKRSRDELVQTVVEPLELRLAALRGVTAVRSTVDDGVAQLVVESEWQTDADRLRIDAERRLSEVAGLGLEGLRVETVSGDRAPVIEVAVLPSAPGEEPARTRFVERTLIPELARLPGAGEVRRVGGSRLRVVVEPIGSALAARGLSASDVVARLQRVGRTRPVGAVRDGASLRPVVVFARVSSLEELGSLRLDAGTPERDAVELREVARIGLREHVDRGSYRLGGRDAVLVEVFRAPGANAVLLAREVRAAIEGLRAQTGPGIELRVVTDGSREVLAALSQLGLAALVGLVLGTVVLRWFLGSWRPTLALTVVVPSSVLAAFGAFLVWGVSLDVVSLAGLALALGMLVDNAIVVLESIESARRRELVSGGDARDAVGEGTVGVALALVAGFATTAAVFVPLLYLRGLARAFFGVQAFAVVSSLALSLVFSLSLTPVLSRLLGGVRANASLPERQPGRRAYLALLRWLLARPLAVVAIFLLVGFGAIALCLETLPRELVPAGSAAGLRVDFDLPEELTAEAARERVRSIDGVVDRLIDGDARARGAIDVRHRARRDRAPGDEEEPAGRVRLAKEGRAEVAAGVLARGLDAVAGARFDVVDESPLLARGLAEASGRWELVVSASTRQRAERLAGRVARALEEDGGLVVERRSRSRRSALRLDWRDASLADLGSSSALLGEQVTAALGGFDAGQLSVEGEGRVGLAEPEILVEATAAPSPGLLPIAVGGAGFSLPLRAVARLEEEEREPAWERRDGRPALVLELGGAAGALRPDRIADALSGVALDQDERWELAGAGHELERSFGQLRLALALGVLLVFLTVAALYESWTLPGAVMSTVPVAAAGGLGALASAGQSLNVMSFLGLILLAGIVVNNAIVLLHRLETERRRGGHAPGSVDLVEATVEAAAVRYRPILMTTLTTLLGMAPLALIGGEGAELRQALAVAVSGGMVAGTLASLLLVPALYVVLRRRLAGARSR